MTDETLCGRPTCECPATDLDNMTAALRTFVDLSRDTFRAFGNKGDFRRWLEERSKRTTSPAAAREADALLTAMDLLGITE